MKHIKRWPFLILKTLIFLLPIDGFAQLTDNFSDRELSNNPTWIGDDTLFSVTANEELQSQGNSLTETIYLATTQTQIHDIEWRIDLRYDFAPSTSNLYRIYLTSDQANMRGALQGYFVQVGESGTADSYDLYRQDGNTLVKIIDGIAGRANNKIDARIRVLRDTTGNWELFTDLSKTDNFTLEGSVVDTTYNNSSYFGISIRHSSTRSHSFFCDNVYVGAVIQDTLAPALLSVNSVSATSLQLDFSEGLESTSAVDVNNYRLLPGNISPELVHQNPLDLAQVSLEFTVPLDNGNTYELVASGIADESGNRMTGADTLPFVFFIPEMVSPHDLIINEIFADPTPSQGLPEAEFLELFNRSNIVFDLENWSISNGSTVGKLPSHLMRPGALLILTRESDAGKFAGYGETISPDTWITLVNGGDNLGLRSSEGILVDSVDYSSEWFQNSTKAAGGFSLERINPEDLLCPALANWGATAQASGGTPGAFNSIYNPNPENDPPELLAVTVLDNQRLRLCFDEPMDRNSIEQISAYNLVGIGQSISAQSEGPDYLCVVLSFSNSLVQGQVYQLEVDGALEDCKGNPIGATAVIPVVLARPAEPFEVVFSEIFPDPNPKIGLPEGEFIEIYNRTEEVLDLSGAILSDGGGGAAIRDLQIFAREYVILCNQSDQQEFQVYGKTLGLENFPSLGNTTDSLSLISASGELLDYVYYGDHWYQNPEKAEGGFSLEKIDPNYLDCNHADNWKASEELTGGTPAKKNSVDGVFVDNEIPAITGLRILDENGLELLFSEQMDAGSLENMSFYTLNQGIGEPLFAFAQEPHYQSVQLRFTSDFLENVIYTLRINGIKDCAGNEIDQKYVFGLPVSAARGDVLINEVLFNPRSGGSDYVEIVNVSEKVIDLASLRIGEIFPDTDSIFNSDILSPVSLLLLPGQIMCLSPDIAGQIQQYQPVAAANFLEMASFPSYDDASGEVVIFTDSGIVLDRFFYEDDFHFPTLIEDEGVSLERISLRRPTNEPGNWHSAASTVRYGTPGYANSQALGGPDRVSEVRLDREVFTPDLDGKWDVVAIEYDFDFAGANARISVLDNQGRLIKIIQQNALLGTEPGAFYWDGSDAKGTKADMGIYLILFELTMPTSGEKSVYKLPVALSARF